MGEHFPATPASNGSHVPDWITLTVEQPHRHNIFMAKNGKNGIPHCALAVCSSNRPPDLANPTLSVSKTFLQIGGHPTPMLKRSNSEPLPLIDCDAGNGVFMLHPQSISKNVRLPSESASESCEKSGSGDRVSSYFSSDQSSDIPGAHVKVGAPDINDPDRAASLRDLMRIQRNGVRSVGCLI